MKRRRGILLAVLGVGLLAVLVAVVWPGEREPEYQGKKLSQWLIAYMSKPQSSPTAQEAANAVRHIGTNALPFLVRWMDYEQPKWRNQLAGSVLRIPVPFPRQYVAGLIMGQRTFRMGLTLAGFQILREEAAPAVPALTQLSRDWTSDRRSQGALCALMFVGTEGLPPLLSVVTNKAVPVPNRRWTAQLLLNFGTNALWAVPILLPCLEDAPVSDCVAGLLAKWRLAPDQVVPALARCLRSPDRYVRAGAVGALGEFGSGASSAVPELVAATVDIDPAVRAATTNALQQIAPKVLTNTAH